MTERSSPSPYDGSTTSSRAGQHAEDKGAGICGGDVYCHPMFELGVAPTTPCHQRYQRSHIHPNMRREGRRANHKEPKCQPKSTQQAASEGLEHPTIAEAKWPRRSQHHKTRSVARSSPYRGDPMQVFACGESPSLGLVVFVKRHGDASPVVVFHRAHDVLAERIGESVEVDPQLG